VLRMFQLHLGEEQQGEHVENCRYDHAPEGVCLPLAYRHGLILAIVLGDPSCAAYYDALVRAAPA
jgi:hypothetical protein